jgi:hypothetical protein
VKRIRRQRQIGKVLRNFPGAEFLFLQRVHGNNFSNCRYELLGLTPLNVWRFPDRQIIANQPGFFYVTPGDLEIVARINYRSTCSASWRD